VGVAQWVALLPHSARVPGSAWVTVCVEFARSPPCLRGAPVSSHTPKDVRVRWIGHAKLHLRVSGVLAWLNIWGYGDRAWVG